MSTKLPVVSGRECGRVLTSLGYEFKSQKGSHMKYIRGSITIIIPDHTELDRGLLRAIIRDAAITIEEFTAQL